MMIGTSDNVDTVARVIQVALTPVFLLSGIGSLLGVFSTRLARVADRVNSVAEKLDTCAPAERPVLQTRLAFLRRRSHALDAAVILGALGGSSTCVAAVLLFVGTLRDQTIASLLLAAFGLALLCTIGALGAFLVEMLMASRGIRDRVSRADADASCGEAAEIESAMLDPGTSAG